MTRIGSSGRQRAARRGLIFALITVLVAVVLPTAAADAQVDSTCTQGTLVGSNCEIEGPPPTPGPTICPESGTVFLDGIVCYTVIGGVQSPMDCVAPYMLGTSGTVCDYLNPMPLVDPPHIATVQDCPLVPQGSRNGQVMASQHTFGPITKVANCFYTPALGSLTCTTAADLGLVGGECRKSVPFVPGPLVCTPTFDLIGNRCVRVEPAVVTCDGLAVTINMNTNGGVGLGTPAADVIWGTPGDDAIKGLGGGDVICADAGNDTIRGGPGIDTIYGMSGVDTIYGGGFADTIYGGLGGDTIYGQGGADTIYGGLGGDTILGGGVGDTIYGGAGKDTIKGGPGGDTMFGGGGQDKIRGGVGPDTLHGEAQNDDLGGGEGNDILFGGGGANDKCAGNVGGNDQAEMATCELTPGVENLF